MSASERSVGSILQGILDSLQELVRSEVALAKREVAEDIQRGKGAIAMLAAGAAMALIGLHFLLWTTVYALALRLPIWAATGIVGALFVLVGGLAVSSALKRWQVISFTPERTVATLKENVEWVKQSTS